MKVTDENTWISSRIRIRISVSHMYRSVEANPDMDPYQNVTDPQHWSIGYLKHDYSDANLSFFLFGFCSMIRLLFVLWLDTLPIAHEWRLWLERKYLATFSYKWENLLYKISRRHVFLLNKKNFTKNHVKYPVSGKNLHWVSTFSHFRHIILYQDFIEYKYSVFDENFDVFDLLKVLRKSEIWE